MKKRMRKTPLAFFGWNKPKGGGAFDLTLLQAMFRTPTWMGNAMKVCFFA